MDGADRREVDIGIEQNRKENNENVPSEESFQEPRFLSMAISIPHLDEQRKLVGRITELESKVTMAKEYAQRTSAKLEALMPAVLERAFKGEL